jgi:hypothetical protein
MRVNQNFKVPDNPYVEHNTGKSHASAYRESHLRTIIMDCDSRKSFAEDAEEKTAATRK